MSNAWIVKANDLTLQHQITALAVQVPDFMYKYTKNQKINKEYE